MQSLDEILTDIHSKTKMLVRKLTELSIENTELKKENTQLKQEILANSKVDLFNDTVSDTAGSLDIGSTSKKDIQAELSKCIEEVKACIDLVK